MSLIRVSEEVERKFASIIDSLRGRFLIYGFDIKEDTSRGCYAAHIYNYPDVLIKPYINISKQWFEVYTNEQFRDFLQHQLEFWKFQEWEDNKIPFICFGFTQFSKEGQWIKCKDCPAGKDSGDCFRCFYIDNPGLEVNPEDDCRYRIIKYSDPHKGHVLALKKGFTKDFKRIGGD